MSLTALEEHRRHVSTLDSGAILGRISWYQVSATRVPHARVKAILERVGLENILSRPPADSDVFRRVFTNGQRREYATAQPGITENLMVREVVSTGERIVKRIVRELVDAAGETLEYEEIADVRFNKSHPERIDVVEMVVNPNAHALVESLAAQYRDERGCLNGKGVRDLIVRGLEACRATRVRDGVFFIMEEYAEKLEALEEIANLMPGALLHSLPLIDDRKQRDLVRKAFESEAAEALDRITTELDEALAGEADPDAFTRFQARLAPVMDKAKQYSELLEDEVGLEQLRIQLATAKLQDLFIKGLGA